jgi:hypothetical protein
MATVRTLRFLNVKKDSVFRRKRTAFTLIELMIVIILLMLFVYLGASIMLPEATKKMRLVTPETLKSHIRSMSRFSGKGTLICTGEPCNQCFFKTDINDSYEPVEASFKLGDIQAYRIDEFGQTERIEYGTFRDEPVCFLIRFYPNGASTPLILSNDKGAYYLPSFFGETIHAKTLQKALTESRAVRESVRKEGIF